MPRFPHGQTGRAAAPQPQHQPLSGEGHRCDRRPRKVQHLVECSRDAHVPGSLRSTALDSAERRTASTCASPRPRRAVAGDGIRYTTGLTASEGSSSGPTESRGEPEKLGELCPIPSARCRSSPSPQGLRGNRRRRAFHAQDREMTAGRSMPTRTDAVVSCDWLGKGRLTHDRRLRSPE